MKIGYFKHGFEIGILLAIIGTQVSKIITEVFGNTFFDMTNLVFFLSLLLVADIGGMFKGQLRVSKQMFLILGYNLYVLVAAILADVSMFEQNKGTVYTLYVIVFLLLISANHKRIDEKFLISAAWWITGIGTCLLMWIITDRFSNVSSVSFVWTSGGADRLTLSVLPFVHLVSSLLYIARTYSKRMLKILFAVVALYDIIACSRRGLMVALVIILIYHIWRNTGEKISKKKFVKAFEIVGVSIFIVVLMANVFPSFISMIMNYLHKLGQGINTYFGIYTFGVDTAAVQRNNVWNTVPLEYLNSGLKVILWGNGYGAKQLDVPYLQAFTDLGLVGGIYYLIVELFYPLNALMINRDELFFKFVQYIGIMTITYNLYSGVPYNHYKFVGVILLAYAVSYYKKQEFSERGNEAV